MIRFGESHSHPPHGDSRQLSALAYGAVRMVADFPIGTRHGFIYARFTGILAGVRERGARHAPLDPDRL
ncbi:hypothetical protein FBY34_3819 [Streptomyces sp. SLBN-115]|nr:hypothetical protein FBY34_3819 [Streptomyces sp. SLBN-115]